MVCMFGTHASRAYVGVLKPAITVALCDIGIKVYVKVWQAMSTRVHACEPSLSVTTCCTYRSWTTVSLRYWLPWLPQIIARMTSLTPGPAQANAASTAPAAQAGPASQAGAAHVLLPLLQRLAEAYPQRVYVPLSLAALPSNAEKGASI